MNKIYFQDTATSAFQPIIDLTFSPFATLSSHAPLHWLNSEFSSIQWGAFMHFYGPTRKLLKIGGLNLEDENFLKINSANENWNLLVSGYLKDMLDIRKKLFFTRLLFYLGFYRQGLQICEKIIVENPPIEDKLWAQYLQELGQSVYEPRDWSPASFIRKIDSLKIEIPPFILFHVYLLFAKYFIRNSSSVDSATKWLDKASFLVENSSFSETKYDLNLSRIRLYKYQADFYFKKENHEKAISLLQRASYSCDTSIKELDKDSHYMYLFKETKRRVLDALILHYYHKGKDKKALEYAEQCIQIDPYCAYALLLAGKTALHIDRELSNNYFEKAAEYGVLERPYAKQALTTHCQKDSPLKVRDLQTEALDGSVFLIPDENMSASREVLKLPIEMTSLRKISVNYSESIHWEQIKKTNVYQRFLPFWELKLSHLKSPIFCSEPLVALEVFKNKELPWFKTLYLQRAMPINFREELIFAAAPHSSFALRYHSEATQLKILQNRSEKADMVLSIHQTIENLPKLDRILFCRLLGSLGFYEEALKRLPIPDKNAQWEPADEYSLCTKLFLEHIYFAGTNFFPYQDIEFVFEKLSIQPESLRMRLVLTMLGSVYHGKKGHLHLLKKWREKGFEVLAALQSCQYFDTFEKQILTSRFYRAVSFYPFLLNDGDTLRKEAEKCESYARSLSPNTEKQKLLYKENLFPMLESTARIFDHLGETKSALNLMEEIVFKVDAHDAKAWIQVGEAREKNGNLEGALEAFQIAIDLGVPLGGIACYRAGRTCEKMGNFKEAKHYYLRSLKFCPKGLSPLKRLYAISKSLDDLYLKNWSETNMNNIKSFFESAV